MNKLILFEDLLNNDTNFPDFDTYLDKYLNLIAEDSDSDSDSGSGISLKSVDSDDEDDEDVIEIFSKKINIRIDIDDSDKLNEILKKYEKTPEDEKIDYSIINKCINCLIIFKYNNKKFKILNKKITEYISKNNN